MKGVDMRKFVLLLVLVVVLSVLCTFFIFDGMTAPTGFATGTGTSTAELSGTVAINIDDSTITFAKGYINVSQDTCTLASNISLLTNSSGCCWINDTSGECTLNVDAIPADDFTINNTGTVVANLTIKSNTTPAAMFGGQDPKVKFAAGPREAGGGPCNGTLTTAWTDVTTTEVDVCDDFLYSSNADTLWVWLNLTFARDVVYGTKYATYTFTATEKPDIQ